MVLAFLISCMTVGVHGQTRTSYTTSAPQQPPQPPQQQQQPPQPQPTTHNPQPTTHNPQPTTHNPQQHTTTHHNTPHHTTLHTTKLSTQCTGVIMASARDALSRIKWGYPPRAKKSWPLPATETEVLLEWLPTAPVSVAASSC